MLSAYTLSAILAIIAIFAFVYFDRANFKRQGIVFLRRTDKGKILVDKLASRFPRFWRFFGNAGMVLFIPAMLLTVFLFAQTIVTVLAEPETRGVGLLLPSPTDEVKLLPGVVAIPFWYWLIGIIIIAVVHELAHGIIARREGIKVKSLGMVLFGPILGAFVEIDEKQMVKKDWKITARIASAGALMNTVFFLIFMLFFIAAQMLLYTSVGMAFAVDPNGPLNATGLGNDTGILKSLNGVTINGYEDLTSYLQNTKPGDRIDVYYMDTNLTEHSATVTLIAREDGQEHGYLGIQTVNKKVLGSIDLSHYRVAKAFPDVTQFIVQFFSWVAILNLLVGLFNLLPARPLDGGLIWGAFAKGYGGKYEKKIIKVTNYIIYGMLLLLLAGILRSIFM